MSKHDLENSVFIYKIKTNNGISSEDMARGAYEFMKALSLPIKSKVVVKPNITVPADKDSGIITHPYFVSGMVDYFHEVGLSGENIMVAEGGGSADPHGMDAHFNQSGYLDMTQCQGVKLVNLNHDEPVYNDLPNADFLKRIGIAKTVKNEETYFINVPKMKTHNLAVTTLSMKNLMGTIIPVHTRHLCGIWSEYAERQNEITSYGITLREEHLCRKLCDLSLASKPDFNIIEGIVGRDGTAFHHGKNIQTNLIIGGKNTTMVDAVASYLMGFDPNGIGYLRIAEDRNLGIIDIEKIRIFEIDDGDVIPCNDINKFMSPIPFEVLAWDKQARNIPLNKEMQERIKHKVIKV